MTFGSLFGLPVDFDSAIMSTVNMLYLKNCGVSDDDATAIDTLLAEGRQQVEEQLFESTSSLLFEDWVVDEIEEETKHDLFHDSRVRSITSVSIYTQPEKITPNYTISLDESEKSQYDTNITEQPKGESTLTQTGKVVPLVYLPVDEETENSLNALSDIFDRSKTNETSESGTARKPGGPDRVRHRKHFDLHG